MKSVAKPHAKPLTGKVALVTGGARRLGHSTALALASAGADVAITYRKSDREAGQTVAALEATGIRAAALPCDITNELSVRRMIAATVKQFGQLDILVNNAANYETAAFSKISLAQWDAIFASNVRGPFLVRSEERR